MDSSPRSYLFTSGTVRIRVDTSPKCGTELVQVVTLHFRDRCGTASLRYRNCAEITVRICEQKPYPVWLSYWRKSYRLWFSRITREPRGTSRSHVTRALPSGLQFEVHACTAEPRSRGKWLTEKFFAPQKITIPRLRKNTTFYNSFVNWLSNYISKQHNSEHNFLAKIEVSEWLNTNMVAAASYPSISSFQIWADG